MTLLIDLLEFGIMDDEIGNSGENVVRGSLKSKATELVFSALGGGSWQLIMEAGRVVNGIDPEKFPKGWESFNAVEEVIEGALPALAGAICGRAVYGLMLENTKLEYNEDTERWFMLTGTVLGYTMMSILGYHIHQWTGQPDVKWY